jgi:hypothetical protein
MALSALSRNTIRRGDKRYSMLKLCVEVVGTPVMATDQWSDKGYVVHGYEGDVVEGQILYPILSVEGRQGRVPVKAKVMQTKPDLVSAILAAGSEGPRILAPFMGSKPLTLTITPAFRTIDWSLSGFMLGDYRGNLQKGQRFEARLQSETAPVAVSVNCYIIRADPGRGILAARIEGISDDAFRFLERAMAASAALE